LKEIEHKFIVDEQFDLPGFRLAVTALGPARTSTVRQGASSPSRGMPSNMLRLEASRRLDDAMNPSPPPHSEPMAITLIGLARRSGGNIPLTMDQAAGARTASPIPTPMRARKSCV